MEKFNAFINFKNFVKNEHYSLRVVTNFINFLTFLKPFFKKINE